jgi:hypothetical protein
MSLPNYLAKIKSAGIYRFVWDKSEVPPQQAETLRLVVGYSEKGPFNTPVYIDKPSDFTSIYGGISKRLEKKGVYFHRLAQQALQVGPILAFNIKPFKDEEVEYINFDCSESITEVRKMPVVDLYDTNRFWAIDADLLPSKIASVNAAAKKYVSIASTDVKENSCSIFVRKNVPSSYSGITFRTWYSSQNIEAPEYMDSIMDMHMDDYFMDIYVFRGKFTTELCSGNGPLAKYFNVDGEKITLKTTVEDAFGEEVDTMEVLMNDSNSNFMGVYSGSTIPYFKDANGNYISIDLKFNADYNTHKMIMKLNDSKLDEADSAEALNELLVLQNNTELVPFYLSGYTYTTIDKKAGNDDIYKACMDQLATKGIRTALTNRVDVEYHYIVDTFDAPVSKGYKKELIAIAKEKDNAFAILNFPKMSKFTQDPKFKSSVTNTFDISKITSDFDLPSEVEGASFGAYYTQLLFSDGSVKNVIPSAALISNLFMNKWGARQPYYIVAGPTYGKLSYSGMVGPDYNFGRSDLDILEPMGINAIVYVPRQGTYVNSNQTAKQVPVSGLSKVHIRELVIYLQNEIEHLLQSYQWELNTQTLRDTIRSKADAICETIKNNGGIYEYINICDETNNTPEVIDNEMIILDTEIEPARGAGKMVHQLTIHRTGGLTSTVK